jgi:hypothetical protein
MGARQINWLPFQLHGMAAAFLANDETRQIGEREALAEPSRWRLRP